MAKTIKVIKCPSCGSAKVTEVKTDYYKCNSCGVDFFLDNDDININHRHYMPNSPINSDKGKKILIFLGFGIFAFIVILNLIPSKPPIPTHDSYSVSTGTNQEDEEEQLKYKWDDSNDCIFLDQKGEPNFIVVGTIKEHRSNFQEKEEDKNVYIGAFDPKTSKKKWLKILDKDVSINSTSDIKMEVFEDNNLYIIIKNKIIYQLKSDLSIQNITSHYVQNNEALSVGIAKVEFLRDDFGSGYTIVTNDGKNLTYMPLINMVYNDKQFYEAQGKALPQGQTKTGYTFSSVDTDFPEEKIHLVKYTFKHQNGYPTNSPRFSWQKDYGRSGIFTGGEPYVKRFINPYVKQQARIVDYEILTADRNYFSPHVLTYNDKQLLIAFKATPAEDDPYQVQILNPKTGAVEKTLAVAEKNIWDKNIILRDGYIFDSSNYIYVDAEGKTINTLKAYDLIMDDKN